MEDEKYSRALASKEPIDTLQTFTNRSKSLQSKLGFGDN